MKYTFLTGVLELKIITLIIITFIVLGVVGSVFYFWLMSGGPVSTTTTRTTSLTSTTTQGGPIVTNVTTEFVYIKEKQDLYLRLKIYGEAYLHDKISINGVYGFWFGHINVTLPNGKVENKFYDPGDYVNIHTQFLQISGVKIIDVYVPTRWYENPLLDGTYRVIVWLHGPYKNFTVLFEKIFNFKFSYNSTVSPAVWNSWNQELTFTLTNTGDVPIIIGRDIGIIVNKTGIAVGIIGWAHAVNLTTENVIMPKETLKWTAAVEIRDDFKPNLKGKTILVSFWIDTVGVSQYYPIEMDVTFPASY
ncbi:MAG: hypothetical protein QW128_08050 [Thermoprotei archaeon]